MTDSIHFAGSDFMLSLSDLSDELARDLMDCGAPGDASEAVAYVLSTYTITGDESDCAAYLRGHGAWEESELGDHAENLKRCVWLCGCDLRESGESHFATY